jgi:CheY-like chemotaxis protein
MLLSARAGEEARVEGMQAGADDYLIKPFFCARTNRTYRFPTGNCPFAG